MKTCYVVGAAPFTRFFDAKEGDLIIAADGGWQALMAKGLRPDLVVGDFDSSPAPLDIPIIRFPKEKDDTDTALAIREGVRRGYERFFLYGCSGGRADHTLANVQVLHGLAKEGLCGYLADDDTVSTVIVNRSLAFEPKGRVSVFSLTDESQGVTLEGLRYSLVDATLFITYPLGVSNEGTGCAATATVRMGALYVIWEE